ncbi:hypothetical protein PtA15_11A458 [Puccinia triticina]|uniref:Uncharacterized protein n=1 Tax=Puccinia triticina TaxID=208348 RepID=A0ABY7CZB1_9BASI|nr:uncharacterized protein PtA15_11A458 [Puccinia triticina]WAQ89767.1 hypothetical protein PtA15_11A458 [Puccinia triticina]
MASGSVNAAASSTAAPAEKREHWISPPTFDGMDEHLSGFTLPRFPGNLTPLLQTPNDADKNTLAEIYAKFEAGPELKPGNPYNQIIDYMHKQDVRVEYKGRLIDLKFKDIMESSRLTHAEIKDWLAVLSSALNVAGKLHDPTAPRMVAYLLYGLFDLKSRFEKHKKLHEDLLRHIDAVILNAQKIRDNSKFHPAVYLGWEHAILNPKKGFGELGL